MMLLKIYIFLIGKKLIRLIKSNLKNYFLYHYSQTYLFK